MKKFILFIIITLTTITVLSGCEVKTSVDDQQKAQQEQMLNDMNNQVGMPNIKEWSEKKMAKQILELRDNSKLITYAYVQNENGKFTFIGQCIGFGLPYSTQYTNPEKLEWHNSGGYYNLPQADPNGLFSPSSVSATWIQYVNPDNGKIEVIYCEPNILITQSKLPKRIVESWSIPSDY